MGKQTTAGKLKKLAAPFQTMLLVLLVCSIYLGCKKKDLLYSPQQVLKNERFYQRDASLATVFKELNGTRTDNLFLNNLLVGFKRSDANNRVANAVTTKLGIPLWDLSVLFKNGNGLKAMATPIVNEQKEVTGMILFAQENVRGIRYKILNRSNPQNKLPSVGNKEGTQFTKASLKGLYQLFEQEVKLLSGSLTNVQSIRTNDLQASGATVHYICWNYEYSFYDPSVGVVIGRTLTQCAYSISFYGSTNEATLAYLEPDSSQNPDGGSGAGGPGELIALDGIATPNDTIIVHLDSFPCAQAALKKMYDVNSQAMSLIQQIYGQPSFPKLTFRVRYDMGDTTVAKFIPDGSFVEFNGTINLNNKFLLGSQDYITATMLHELLHGYIYWRYTEMVSINHDTAAFDLMFPIYSSIPRQGQKDHEEMATNYVKSISNILKLLNPNLDDTISKALAWGGLEETSTYKNMPKDSTDKYGKINYDAIHLTNPANENMFIKCK